ncbi:hypothetical protein [Labilibaculum sp.]|uniref:hypothetical protein n=1 Tax=Labilibaculum sp. TaxID=2060723 RepID=UPI003563D51F
MKVDYSKEDLILKVYPTVGGCFEEGWTVLKKHFLVLLLAIIFMGFVQIPMGLNKIDWNNIDFFGFQLFSLKILAFFYYLLVVIPFKYGIDWLFLRASRNTEPQMEEILKGFKRLVPVVLSQILVFFIVGFGFVLLVLPGIYLICKMIFVPFLVLDKKVDAIQAVKLSFYMSKGYFWTIFGMAILSFFIFILGLICLIVGVVISIVWIRAAFAVLYKAVDELHFKEACELAGISFESIKN